MVIGGTFQLMSLGVANIGGSSVPNWGLAALVGGYVAIKSTTTIEEAKAVALAVGVPVGMLGIQLDVLAKILNTYVAHWAQKAANAKQFEKMNRILWIGPLIFGLSTAIPTTLCVLFGQTIVTLILNYVPDWVTSGLTILWKYASGCGDCFITTSYAKEKIFIPIINWLCLDSVS